MSDTQRVDDQRGQIEVLRYRIDSLEHQLKEGFSALGDKLDTIIDKQGSQLAVNAVNDGKINTLISLYDNLKEQLAEYKTEFARYKETESGRLSELSKNLSSINIRYAKLIGICVGVSGLMYYIMQVIGLYVSK